MIIAFSEGSLPADYENKQSNYPLITVEYPLKGVEEVLARLWLEELWREIRSTEKDEEVRKHKIPKKVNRSIEMAAAMAYTFMRGCVYICNVYDLYSKDGVQYTGIPFLVTKAIIDGYNVNYYWLHREEVKKYIETRLAKEESQYVKQIWERVILPPFAIPPCCWRIALSPYVDLFLAVHHTTPHYVEQRFPNLEEEIEKIEKNKNFYLHAGETDDEWKKEDYEQYIKRMNFSDNVMFQRFVDIDYLKRDLRRILPPSKETESRVEFLRPIVEDLVRGVGFLGLDHAFVLWNAGTLYETWPKKQVPPTIRGIVMACIFSYGNIIFEENVAEYIFRNYASKIKLVLQAGSELHPEPKAKLGETLYHLKRYQEAHAEFSKALTEDPKTNGNHLSVGKVMWRMGILKDAEQHIREEFKIDPENPDAHFYLGSVMGSVSREAEARGDIHEAVRAETEAIKEYEETQRLAPKRKNTGMFLIMERMRLKALEEQQGHQSQQSLQQPQKTKKKRFGIF